MNNRQSVILVTEDEADGGLPGGAVAPARDCLHFLRRLEV